MSADAPRTDTQDTDPFATGHLDATVETRAVRSGKITAWAQIATIVLQFASTAVLARLLFPEDFGLIAMGTAAVGFFYVFSDWGVTVAIVQNKNITGEDANTLFWLNLGVTTLITLVLLGLSPLLAWLYNEPKVLPVLLLMNGSIFLTGLCLQHEAILHRQMRVGRVNVHRLVARVFGIALAIILAWWGASYWALVAMHLSFPFVRGILAWHTCPWRPGWPRWGTRAREFLSFGGRLTAATICEYMARNMDDILLGRFCGSTILGYYSKAYNLLLFPILRINAPLSTVVVPTLSRLQNDPERFRAFYCQAVGVMAFISMPIAVFSFTAAEDLVLLLLGDNWLPVVPLIHALAPAAFLGSINFVKRWITLPLGLARKELQTEFGWAVLCMLGFVIGLRWGAFGVGCAFSLSYLIALPVQLSYVYRGSAVGMKDLLSALWRPAIACLVGAGLTWAVHAALPGVTRLLVVPLEMLAFSLGYLGVWLLVPGGYAILQEAWRMLRGRTPTPDDN